MKKEKTRTSSQIKKSIQALLRKNAIKRDESCVVGKYPWDLPSNARECGDYRQDGEIIVQAEHLCGRANSASYGDMDNIVLVCRRHHIFFKRQHPAIYWEIIRKHIGEERWEKVQAWEKDHTPHRFYTADWLRIESELTSLLAEM